MILEKDGLSFQELEKLSFKSNLDLSLKSNLHYFEYNSLMADIENYIDILDQSEILATIKMDYRIKSMQSVSYKYDRYPIEIQYNTYYDRQLNNWLHKYLYKKDFATNSIGKTMREYYENGKIKMKTSLRRCLAMCYLVAKKFNEVGSLAIKAEHGKALADFKKMLYSQVKDKNIQLVTISKPSAYGEYEPFTFVEQTSVFEKMVKEM